MAAMDVVAVELGIGLIVPYDFALDRELWRWAPPQVSLQLTRTPYAALPVGLTQARTVGDAQIVARCAADLLATEPSLIGYACTSGSFIGGCAGERALARAILTAGAPDSVTTSGALAEALRALGCRSVVAATPYGPDVNGALVAYLGELGVRVEAVRGLGLTGHVWRVPAATTAHLVRAAVRDARVQGGRPDGVVVSCTNLAAYEVIAELEAEFDVPVLSANQVTMWGALRRVGYRAVGPGQRLLEVS